MKGKVVRRLAIPPIIAGMIAEIGFAAAIGGIGILVCAAVLLVLGAL